MCDLSNGSFVSFAQVAKVMGRQGRPCFAFFNSQSTRLKVVREIGRSVLSKGDALFLRRLLTADAPTPDHKSDILVTGGTFDVVVQGVRP